ncbi:MAG: hypothetical protein IKG42_04855 [Clostridia bacterium]|nr:hypothetical protein [Clostridia bacterium]
MLKIKDDVDLTQLKFVYGFEDDNENGFYNYYVGNTQCLRINMWNRKIKIRQMCISSYRRKQRCIR